MNMSNKIKSFFRPDLNLTSRWWHRLLKVVFVVTTTFLIIVTPIGLYHGIELKPSNTKIIYSIEDFTRKSYKTGNVVPDFLALNGEFGCLNVLEDEYTWLYEYKLKEQSYCNRNLENSLDTALPLVSSDYKKESEKMKTTIKESILNLVHEKNRVCLIHEDKRDKCAYENIVKYERSNAFFLHVALFSILIWFCWITLCLVLYFKGFLYIIFGRKKE